MDQRQLIAFPRDWKKNFDGRVLQAGRIYKEQGRVLRCEVTDGGHAIEALVKGSAKQPYAVRVDWNAATEEGVVVSGRCTCPMMFNCKHTVATIFDALGVEETPQPAAAKPAKEQLDRQLQSWLQQLEKAAAPETAEEKPITGNEPERLAYVLNLENFTTELNVPAKLRLSVGAQVVSKLPSGGYGGAGRNIYLENLLSTHQLPPYVRNEDLAIVRRIKLNQPTGIYYGRTFLIGEEGAALLQDLLRTRRCHWKSTGKKHPVLALGPARLAKLQWKADAQGMQSPGLSVSPVPTAILPLAPPWYVDEATATCGVLDTGLPPAVAEAWFNAPMLTPDQAEILNEELTRRFPDLQIPPPQRIEIETVANLKPVPCLRLFSQKVSQQNYGYYHGASRGLEMMDLNLARLEFDYDGTSVRQGEPGAMIENFHDGKLRRIKRNLRHEMQSLAMLGELGFNEARDDFFNYRLGKQADALTLPDANAWFHFSMNVVPRLRDQGWRVEIEESFKFRLVEPEDWYADATESSSIDWFGVEIGVHLNGQKVNLMPILLHQLQSNPGLLSEEMLARYQERDVVPVHLPDGRLLAFPVRRLKEMLGVLLELFDAKSLDARGRLRLSKLRAAELSKTAGSNADWRWMGGEQLRELSRKLNDFNGINLVAPSPNLRATLRGYQQEGLNWLQFLREYDLAGILADDMGLGKTLQALAHLLYEHESGRANLPSLVVAPTSLMTNWRQETERFAPKLKVLVLHGADRKQNFEKIKEHDLIITSYPLLPRDQAVLMGQEFHFIILDEAQFIKNPKTRYAQIVCALQGRHRLCLTGTPMENHLGELWSLFNFLLPGFLGDEMRFRKVFRGPIEKGQSEERRKLLAQRVAPFVLRRRKEEVVKELPPKTEIVQNVELAGAQRDLYETIRLAMHARVREEVGSKGLSRAHIVILDALLKLRQVCCDPRLVKLETARQVEESAKLQLLMDLLPEMIAEGRRVLLFSQFTSMLALIEPELAKAKIPHVLLTGQTTDRTTPINRFQNGEVPMFLISLKAGGTGLNLTAADTVIHYDPWWNPAVENQATDRAHRIGQEKPVFVYKLMTVGTVEEKILELQKRKRDLVEGLLDDERKDSLKLSSEDLDVLFAPIK